MLKLNSDRLDYGEQLRAPSGYTLDLALATTFSLDLEALVAASLALSLEQTLEGDVGGERIAVLESLDMMREKLLVFYQHGNVKIPQRFNRLFALLEPVLIPTGSMEQRQAAFSSFHPKIWLLRFVADKIGEPALFRLLVLSRNLTFDRSWDVAVVVDGIEGDRRTSLNTNLVEFLRLLPVEKDCHVDRLQRICECLDYVEWDLSGLGFEKLAMLPGHASSGQIPGKVPFDLDGDIDELLVISPFIDADQDGFLLELASRTRNAKTLISRADTLDAVGKESLAGWNVKSLSKKVLDGEERMQEADAMMQNLHAKLIVVRQRGTAVWHVGSANLTNAAFGKAAKGVAPRNTEFMLRFEGRNHKVGPQRLLEEWADIGVFENHEFQNPASVLPDGSADLRQLVHALATADWSLSAVEDGQGTYSLTLSVSPVRFVPQGFRVEVGLLCRPACRFSSLSESMTWGGVKLTEISAFIPLEVSAPTGHTFHFAVQAALSIELDEERQGAIFRETVGDTAKLLGYLTLLLDSHGTKEKWQRIEGDGSGSVFELIGHGALYEQLLISAAQEPRRLRRALHVFDRMRDEGVDLPAGLAELFEGFSVFAKDAK